MATATGGKEPSGKELGHYRQMALDEMMPRSQLSSAPFAMQALTVPASNITLDKIVTDAISTTPTTGGAVAIPKHDLVDG